MKILSVKDSLTSEQTQEVCEILRAGGLVIYPTDTAYGLGALVSSKEGVDKLFEYKDGREGKAVSMAIQARKMATKYVELNDTAEDLYERYLPGAVTVISRVREGSIGNKVGQVDQRIISEKQTLGIRIPDFEIVWQITGELGEGITSTSANLSNKATPYSVQKLLESLPEEKKSMIDLVIDAGVLPPVETSTIVDTTVEPMEILRGKLPKIYNSSSEQETYEIAAQVLNNLEDEVSDKPIVILLEGEMGAGKTQFVKGLARALRVEREVISPTFVLERQYDLPNSKFEKLYHYDLWRVNSQDETRVGEFVENLGMISALQNINLIAIEWPENVAGLKDYFFNENIEVFEVKIDQKEKDRIIKTSF